MIWFKEYHYLIKMSDEIIDDALNEVNKQKNDLGKEFLQVCTGLSQTILNNISNADQSRLQDTFDKMLVSANEMTNSSSERTSSKSSRKPKHVKFQEELSENDEDEWEDENCCNNDPDDNDPDDDDHPDNDEAMNEYDTEWSAFHKMSKAYLILLESFSLLLKKYRE